MNSVGFHFDEYGFGARQRLVFMIVNANTNFRTLPLYDATVVKTCYRCGGEFSSPSGRICSVCRKPRVRVRKPAVSRDLSFREKQIAHLVCQAKLNKEIAFELHLTEGTIKEYLNRIFRKLEVKNRTELAIWTMRNLEVGAGLTV